MMRLYVVMYHDDSWGSTGDRILGIYDDEEKANELANRVKNMKDFEELSGSYVEVSDYILNEQAMLDSEIDYYLN